MEAKQMADRLRQNPELVRSLMQSSDGQRLMSMLSGGGGDVQGAAQSAAQGDTRQMMQMIAKVMRSPEGAALAERIRKSVEGQ